MSWIQVQPSAPLTWKAIRWTGANLDDVREVLGGSVSEEYGAIGGLSNGKAQPGDWIIWPPLGMQQPPFSVRHEQFVTDWQQDEWTPEEWELARSVIANDRMKEAQWRAMEEKFPELRD
ncbi:hypothetical protein [Saccharopolyspora hattusasensis]|uniref:hypothetical protein n=1 Tax=Saccharopolyspora hattusasensis TaxID=1128679 RepID=UPI003D95720D